MIDLRSDTVTLPSPSMRDAIARAELGDDVFGEDPTVNRLQDRAAALMGKAAGLLVSSGTMGNLIALMVHCARGRKALVGAKAHVNQYEAGSAGVLGGVVISPIANRDNGELDLAELEAELGKPSDVHFARPALIALENTHNLCGGTAVPLSHMAQVRDLATTHGLAVHLDGARIFNAALALETDVRSLAGQADSVTFCLSKGLACPVGSVLCGPADFIAEARRIRKLLGGGMRQAGIFAAAGLVALADMTERLREDHDNAAALAQGLANIPRLRVQPAANRTNMVFLEVSGDARDADRFEAALQRLGVLLARRGSTSFRAVTHYGIDRPAILSALSALSQAAGEVSIR